MKAAPAIALPLLLCAAAAQDAAPAATTATAPATPAAGRAEPALSRQETHVRTGIAILAKMLDTLATVQDRDTAEAAVAPLMRLGEQLTLWAKATATLPPLSELERMELEDRYMPLIKRVNDRLKSQAERIAAAEFYGSRNLPAALVHVVQSAVQ
ncbi:MAG: hypothetical protein MJ058_07970 [Akkermansia sp.]|nr:hypothetical protein [Akkermansia sp.]